MERTLKRELRLDTQELARAVKFWLVSKHDIQIGEKPLIEFTPDGIVCRVTSLEEAIVTLPKLEG